MGGSASRSSKLSRGSDFESRKPPEYQPLCGEGASVNPLAASRLVPVVIAVNGGIELLLESPPENCVAALSYDALASVINNTEALNGFIVCKRRESADPFSPVISVIVRPPDDYAEAKTRDKAVLDALGQTLANCCGSRTLYNEVWRRYCVAHDRFSRKYDLLSAVQANDALSKLRAEDEAGDRFDEKDRDESKTGASVDLRAAAGLRGSTLSAPESDDE